MNGTLVDRRAIRKAMFFVSHGRTLLQVLRESRALSLTAPES